MVDFLNINGHFYFYFYSYFNVDANGANWLDADMFYISFILINIQRWIKITKKTKYKMAPEKKMFLNFNINLENSYNLINSYSQC